MALNIYEIRRRGTIAFMALSMVVVGVFLYFSDSLVSDLSHQERARMQIWADATREILRAGSGEGLGESMDFPLSIIEANASIPVMLTDSCGNILMHRNFNLPEPQDALSPMDLSERNSRYLDGQLAKMQHGPNVIRIEAQGLPVQYLYYQDSNLLRALSLYPWVQVVVLAAFILIVYYALSSTHRAEQNKVWVGLSKETAHQLGTPISSLMAWMELLPSMGLDPGTVAEMDKDVKRLSTIASRFGKIGSRPAMEPGDLALTVETAAAYMSSRISRQVRLNVLPPPGPMPVSMCGPLLQWVVENLIKNAVDAMEGGTGTITITPRLDQAGNAVIDITDTGKGISRKHQKAIFNPGFTTKSRGWGLGLTLARRIIGDYHRGRIFVNRSEPGVGTTFTIEMPLTNDTPSPPGT